MPLYAAGGLTTVTASGAATLGIKAGAADIKVFEIACVLNAATATVAGLYRSTAAGTNSTTVTPTNEETATASAALTRCETAWSVQPTLAAVPVRTAGAPAAVGNFWVWQFMEGLYLAAGSSVVVKLEQLSSALRFHVVVRE
jgi:hypothetical protein